MTSVHEYHSLEPYWMPFTSNYSFKQEPRIIAKSEGMYLWNESGQKILDGASGLFCVALGHCRQEIADAVYHQMMTLDYAAPFQQGQPSAFALAERLTDFLPGDLNRVFLCNSGSESIDTAMKLAVAYHHANGEAQRTRFVSRERAYHGVNLGGTSLSGIKGNRQVFEGITLNTCHLRHTWTGDECFHIGQPQQHGVELANDLQRIAETIGGHNIAACFVEPIAGSTGILVPPVGYLERLREICDEHGILLVFDEVITGFGRTGAMFAAESFNVQPDIMTMAKALTNGAQPMGAVAVKQSIYDKVVNASPKDGIEFFHGYTYSGHPAACAAAMATLEIFKQEQILEHVAEITPYFLEQMQSLQDIEAFTDIRGYGLIAGIDLKPQGAPGAFGAQTLKELFNAGLHAKFTGDCVLVAPPLICNKSHIDQIVDILREVYGS